MQRPRPPLARTRKTQGHAVSRSTLSEREVIVQSAGVELAGSLTLPDPSAGLVLFDLLTTAEERIDDLDRSLRFDIPLLSGRLVGAIDWAGRQPELGALPIGLFGASTGAAAAITAAAARPHLVGAVVARGGRPDLAAAALQWVGSPTLFIVGGWDDEVLQLNQQAAAQLTAPHALEVVPGASHLFEEPGTLEQAAHLAPTWFLRHLTGART